MKIEIERATVQQALGALEKFGRGESSGIPLTVLVHNLREALAEPAVDQDTWVFACDLCGKPVPEGVDPWHFSTHTSRHSHACDECVDSVPIFEAQQPAEVPLLTAAEILAIMRGGNNCNYNDEGEHVDFARAVEQAVRQKAGIK